jgi:predicted acylesterase/phospholipase RssA
VHLHRGHGHPLVHVAAPHDDVGHRLEVERRVRRLGHGQVVLPPGDDRRRAGGQRLLGVDVDGQRVDVGPHHRRGVLALGERLGEHDGDRLPDEPHAVDGQRRPGEVVVQAHEPVVGPDAELGGGPHGHDPRHRPGLVHLDRPDRAVGGVGAHEHGVQRVLERQVGHVAAGTSQQLGILGADHAGAEDRPVGELGLLDRAPRSATVRAVRDTTLASFSTSTFEELVATSPSMMLNVTRRIITRLRSPSQRKFDRAASLTVAVTAPCDADALVAEMAAEIARFGTTKHLSSDRVDRVLNRVAISQASTDNVGVPRLAEFMHEADVGNDHVVLQTDRGITAWTRRALRQADRVVVVCSPNPDAAERSLISEIFDTIADAGHVARMLAVLHPVSADRPRRTGSLIARWHVDDVVHVRSGSSADLARLARLASGHGYGLVLSGGGARGFAHLGVLRALREHGVPVDQVAGCSMGTVVAAAIAQGHEGDHLMDLAEQQFHRLLDYTLPVVSLVKGARITRNIEATFGSWDVEDLWLPFYCVSTNLTKSRLEVHRRGSTALAIRASVAIPGVLPPVPHEGDLLVDGGVLNNLPFEVMRDDSTIGTIIAVDVAPDQGPRARADYGMSVSGFKALGASLKRTKSDYPSVTSILLRSMLTGAVRNQQASMQDGSVDLLLSMHLPGIGLLEFDRSREVADAGYAASVQTVGDWAAARSELGAT